MDLLENPLFLTAIPVASVLLLGFLILFIVVCYKKWKRDKLKKEEQDSLQNDVFGKSNQASFYYQNFEKAINDGIKTNEEDSNGHDKLRLQSSNPFEIWKSSRDAESVGSPNHDSGIAVSSQESLYKSPFDARRPTQTSAEHLYHLPVGGENHQQKPRKRPIKPTRTPRTSSSVSDVVVEIEYNNVLGKGDSVYATIKRKKRPAEQADGDTNADLPAIVISEVQAHTDDSVIEEGNDKDSSGDQLDPSSSPSKNMPSSITSATNPVYDIEPSSSTPNKSTIATTVVVNPIYGVADTTSNIPVDENQAPRYSPISRSLSYCRSMSCTSEDDFQDIEEMIRNTKINKQRRTADEPVADDVSTLQKRLQSDIVEVVSDSSQSSSASSSISGEEYQISLDDDQNAIDEEDGHNNLLKDITTSTDDESEEEMSEHSETMGGNFSEEGRPKYSVSKLKDNENTHKTHIYLDKNNPLFASANDIPVLLSSSVLQMKHSKINTKSDDS